MVFHRIRMALDDESQQPSKPIAAFLAATRDKNLFFRCQLDYHLFFHCYLNLN